MVLLFLLFFTACQTQPRFTAEPLPRYDAAFDRASGWTGGDGAYTVALGRDRVLWLFGDTFVGRVQAGRRVGSTLINNSAALQAGAEPSQDSPLRFSSLRTESGGSGRITGFAPRKGFFCSCFRSSVRRVPRPSASGWYPRGWGRSKIRTRTPYAGS